MPASSTRSMPARSMPAPSVPAALPPVLRTGFRFIPALTAIVFGTLWVMAEAGRGFAAGTLVVFLLLILAIALSAFLPTVALGIGVGVTLLQVVFDALRFGATSWPIYLALPIIVLFVSVHGRRTTRWIALGSIVLSSGAIAAAVVLPVDGWMSWTGRADYLNDRPEVFLQFLLAATLVQAAFWVAGFAWRISTAFALGQDVLKRTTTELTAAEADIDRALERQQIAQDVHDILAHSLSVVIAQADGARFIRSAKPEKTDLALGNIADAARSALIDVRALIEGLRDNSHDLPQPGLEDLPVLVERMLSAGMRLDVEEFGEPTAITPARELAAYRIVQEGLTNALKHSGRQPVAKVSLDWTGPGLAISVISTGSATKQLDAVAPNSLVTGHGIPGMRERARLVGGWLTSGTSTELPREWVVTAFIPAGEPEPATATALVEQLFAEANA